MAKEDRADAGACACGKGCRVILNDETECCTCTLEKFRIIYGYEFPGYTQNREG